MASKRHDFDRCTTSLQTDFTCLALYVLAFSLLRATQATRAEPVHISIWAQVLLALTELVQRNWLLTTRLVQAAQAAGAWVFLMGDRRVLGWGAQGDMQILSPRDAWMRLFLQGGGN